LDPNQLIEIRNLIVGISKDAIVLFSTHILQEVSAICSSVLVLHKAKLVANTLINDLLKPTQPAVRVVFEEEIEPYLTDPFFQGLDFEKQDKHVLVIKSKDINKLKKEVLNFALAKSLNIQALQTQEASLEEIFKLLTH
jgi:ABC-2 type transport system ATP-binding protein